MIRLETIPEEEELREECHGDDGISNLDKHVEEQESILDDSLSKSSVENCESCGEHSEEQATQGLEEGIICGWRGAFNWDDFAYNLILGFLPTAWDVLSDLQVASHLKVNAEVDSAGLSYLFICFPGLHLSLDLLTRRLSLSCSAKVVVLVYVVCGITFSFAMLFSVWSEALLLEYPAFIVGLAVVGVKAIALFVHTPSMKQLSVRVTKYETDTESPFQLLLLLHIWVSGGPLFLGPIGSSLLVISKVKAEAHLSSSPENLLEGTSFLEKLKLITKFLDSVISTTIFRVGSGLIKHSGPYTSVVAEPHQTLFFFFTVLCGCIVYYMLYVAIFWGLKLIFAKQLTDITLMEGARSALAEFSTVSLWGTLGRIRSRFSFSLRMFFSVQVTTDQLTAGGYSWGWQQHSWRPTLESSSSSPPSSLSTASSAPGLLSAWMRSSSSTAWLSSPLASYPTFFSSIISLFNLCEGF